MFHRLKSQSKYELPFCEIHLVDHCNLKCDNCRHYCHIVDEEVFINVGTYREDLSELAKKIKFRVIFLLGGEPLLHPQINEIIAITRELYPFSFISVLTNGLLLPSMEETFWNTLRKNKVSISLSKYPILGNKFSELLDLIDDKKVLLGEVRLSKRFYFNLNIEGKADKNKSYKACVLKNSVNLWKHRLYACNSCYRYYYNKKFDSNLVLPDSIDFYKKSGKEIYNAFKKPMEACRFCNEKSIELDWKLYSENKV